MTNVLIAVDDSDTSRHTAELAHRLFGDDASYTVLSVAEERPVVWGDEPLVAGYPYPIVMPGGSIVATASLNVHDQGHPERTVNAPIDEAAHNADSVATEAGVFATPMGDVGDPAEAILRAADTRGADVIVVGSHERGWFSRLVRPSVSTEVVRDAHVPVLVVH